MLPDVNTDDRCMGCHGNSQPGVENNEDHVHSKGSWFAVVTTSSLPFDLL